MPKVISTFLRRATRYPAGIAVGGGETGFYPMNQQHEWLVALFGTSTAFKDVLMPKGSIITSYLVIPFNGNDSVIDGVAATGGTVTIDTWNITTNASITSLLGSTSASAYSSTAVGSPTLLAADTRIRFRVATTITPYTAGANGNGAVLVGFRAFLPRLRP